MNITFTGKFSISSNELSKVSFFKKLEFLKQKDTLIDEFCKKQEPIKQAGNGFILNIKDEKEDEFLKFISQFKINAEKLD